MSVGSVEHPHRGGYLPDDQDHVVKTCPDKGSSYETEP